MGAWDDINTKQPPRAAAVRAFAAPAPRASLGFQPGCCERLSLLPAPLAAVFAALALLRSGIPCSSERIHPLGRITPRFIGTLRRPGFIGLGLLRQQPKFCLAFSACSIHSSVVAFSSRINQAA
jgi:hypothetical protein